MVEWGVFNDEGCLCVFDTRIDAECYAQEMRAEDQGYYSEVISVEEMCPDHRDEEYSLVHCEACFD